jgi:hypothetical protein
MNKNEDQIHRRDQKEEEGAKQEVEEEYNIMVKYAEKKSYLFIVKNK